MNDEEKRIIAQELVELRLEIAGLRAAIEELSGFPPLDIGSKRLRGGIGTDPPTTIEVTVPGWIAGIMDGEPEQAGG